jgi:putative peptidoglycan lipid II flippase
MLAGLTNGVLYSYKRFSSAAFGPVIYNLGTIVSLLVFRKASLENIAIGIACSAFIYFLFQLSFAIKDARFYRFKIFFTDPGFQRLVKLAIPSLIAASIVQFNGIISQHYTSNYVEGSVLAFMNANNIWQLPYGIFAMGLGSAILPTLSEKLALGQVNEFKRLISKSLKNILLLTVPSAIAFIVIGDKIVSAIYKWSIEVDAKQINLTANILLFFTLTLFTQSILAIITRAYYANNDTRIPLFLGAGSIIINGLACYLFFKTTNLGAAGMSLATSISSTFYAVTMIYILNKKMKGLFLGDLLKFIIKTLIAAVFMGSILFFMNLVITVDFSAVFTMKAKIIELGTLALEVIIGAIVYFSVILIMKVPEGKYIFNTLSIKVRSFSSKFINIFKEKR